MKTIESNHACIGRQHLRLDLNALGTVGPNQALHAENYVFFKDAVICRGYVRMDRYN